MKAEIRDCSDKHARVQIVVPTRHKAFSYQILAGPTLAKHLANLPGLPISVICEPDNAGSFS
ncbi:MAG: hypothetical protein K0R64_2490 [Novosphingobium lindaniclasticum]|uniref:hypothetical protein n=1 Tax=Novosphingobium lindaniclasticum TaxID=1329895 RepID=UPI00240A5622|nr:hypothetical protein [Novosphingobium lindaniclasticum]MDF2639506.1 hypothetical protein [Novosphingobium lindaniclasticum]